MLKIFKLYKDQGFIVKVPSMDREFQSLRPDLNVIYLNTSAMSEHKP